MSRWGILCPGPSLALYSTQKKISLDNPDILVAVNGAILLSDFKIDYWVMQDIEVFEDIIKKIDISQFYSTRLWIPRRWLTAIPADYDKLNYHFQAFYKETFPSETKEVFNEILPFKCAENINWTESTIFPAIGLAIISGAKEIRIYGADMAGQGYFIKGLENYRTRHDEKRWAAERHYFNSLTEECKKHGIVITKEENHA